MKFNLNTKRSGIIAVMAALVLLMNGCKTPGGQQSNIGYSAVESSTADPSVSEPENPGGGNSAVSSGTESEFNTGSDSESTSDDTSDLSSGSGDTDNSDVSNVTSSGSETTSSSNGTTSSASKPPESSLKPPASSSTVPEIKPPVNVVIPDFPVPTSSGEKIFTSSAGWINYSNASNGYISAMYTGTKLRSKIMISANGMTPPPFDLSVGGVIEYFPLSMGNGTYTVTLFEQIEGNNYATLIRSEFEVNMPNPRSPFMYSNRYVKYDKNSKCVYKAAELCAGKTDNISKISAIFQWVTENIKYDDKLAATVPKTYYPDPDTTYSKKTGICYDYASLMAAMLRSQGIPTRLVIGYTGDLKHAWNEIYTEQTGWITPELMLGNNGYNTVDATFYAGTTDKARIAQYISNPSNYVSEYYY